MPAQCKVLWWTGVLAVAVIGCRTTSDTHAPKTTSPEVKLSHTLDSICKAYQVVGMSVALVSDTAFLYAHSWGQAQLGAARPMTDSTFARVASVSKVLTALAVMQLYEQGKFSLEDDISPALGFQLRNPNFPDKPITYRQLLQHTSSLESDEAMPAPYYVLWRDPTLRLSDVLSSHGARYNDSVYRSLWSKHPPGTRFAYSNLGYALLGTLVERHSGKRFDQYCTEHIFAPLGLKASFNVMDIPTEQLAYPYREVQGRWMAQADSVRPIFPLERYEVGSNALLFSPQGGLRISIKELGRLVQLFLNSGQLGKVRLVSEQALRIMEQNPLSTSDALFGKYALGLCYADSLWKGVELIGHSGQAYGLLSGFYYNRPQRLGVTMLITGSRYRATGSAFYDVELAIYDALYHYLIEKGKIAPLHR
ncbi:MAG: serine hydrolase domain-containing protein [Chloroherpetonaceae bacterium]|nr:beta-lactamase family protein [Chloroherpetonaceae bacterium]MCS7211174.1 beta-lactamase family protein [Chloroherpetonaceae bacterium]MDW8020327.1 serine hydrolase domain-containing protein [Chloroherpetonaceae bacterium]